MADRPPDRRELGFYFSLAQVGMEMVVPIGVGLALDHYLGWRPWGAIGGTVFGFVGGLFHLLQLVNRHDAEQDKPTRKPE